MNIVFSFYAGNRELAKHTLQHASRLNPKSGRNVLLVRPHGLDDAEIIELLKPWANGLTVLSCEEANGWPLGKNVAWQAAARWMYGKEQPWLWWEPDAIPLKESWVTDIEAEYTEGLLGCRNNSGYFDGVAVYPANVLEFSMGAMLCRAAPFDQAGKELAEMVRPSKAIRSVWDINGKPASFKTMADVESICGQASLFHRCKDGSLANVLTNGGELIQGKSLVQDSKCVVMLGRYGDIINILPVCREMAQKGDKISLLVAEQFADLLDGVGYVKREVFTGSFTDLKGGIEQASRDYSQVLVAQVNSRNVGENTKCGSFTEESWRQLGYLDKFDGLPLVFDKRDFEREQTLVSATRQTDRPLLLVNFTGKSSPLPCSDALMTHLLARWTDAFEIVDLGAVKAERVYDLLGLMDAASCLITIDTATLHLSRASGVPTIALLSETPTLWHGSRPPKSVALARRYSEVMEHLHEIDVILDGCQKANSSMPSFRRQTEYPTGIFDLPLNTDVHHFNPGLVRDGSGKLWLLARKSAKNREGKFDSQLLACRLDEGMNIVEKKVLDIPAKKFSMRQHEDPRVIWKNERFFVTFCGWNRRPKPMRPKQIIGIFSADWKYEGHFQPEYGHNHKGTTGVEKNWALFGHAGRFQFIYQFKPHIVVEIQDNQRVMPQITAHDLKWEYGEVRGGTPPVLVGDEYVTFFHSSLPWQGGRRRYYMGAYSFEATAPFNVKRITKTPLLCGSENDTRIHGGPPVIFPCGALLENGTWTVTFGINDEACGWMKMPQRDLEEKLCT